MKTKLNLITIYTYYHNIIKYTFMLFSLLENIQICNINIKWSDKIKPLHFFVSQQYLSSHFCVFIYYVIYDCYIYEWNKTKLNNLAFENN